MTFRYDTPDNVVISSAAYCRIFDAKTFGAIADGAIYDRMIITNITANANAHLIFNHPIHIMVNRWKDTSKLGGIRKVLISNFICETGGRIVLTCAEGGFIHIPLATSSDEKKAEN